LILYASSTFTINYTTLATNTVVLATLAALTPAAAFTAIIVFTPLEGLADFPASGALDPFNAFATLATLATAVTASTLLFATSKNGLSTGLRLASTLQEEYSPLLILPSQINISYER
jgi:hypothetical protein